MMTLRIETADDDWEDIAEGDCPDDPGARILLRGGLTINGVSFHLEGWAVEVNERTNRTFASRPVRPVLYPRAIAPRAASGSGHKQAPARRGGPGLAGR